MAKKTYSAAYFKRQGQIGGTIRAAKLSPAQRSASATKASKAAALARTKKKKARDA